MTDTLSSSSPYAVSKTSFVTAVSAIVAAAAAILALAALHALSPEFHPAWRMVSEYALGNFGWVLSLMFIFWALASWALAAAILPLTRKVGGRIGILLLVVSGFGEAMASVFDISQSLHGTAALIGIPTLPVAAMLISVSLGRTEPWSEAKKSLLWTANLTWASVVLMAATFALMIYTYTRSGAPMTPGAAPKEVPEGVIGLVGWANRLLILAYCVWIVTVARQVIKLFKGPSR